MRALCLLFALACTRHGVTDAGTEDAAVADEGVLDTGIVNDGTLIGEIGIVTWNLEQFPKTATTTRVVEEVILSLSPDLVGVQEIAEPLEFEHFADRLPGYAGRYVYTRDFIRVGFL